MREKLIKKRREKKRKNKGRIREENGLRKRGKIKEKVK